MTIEYASYCVFSQVLSVIETTVRKILFRTSSRLMAELEAARLCRHELLYSKLDRFPFALLLFQKGKVKEDSSIDSMVPTRG